ncbi:hypothetical protein ACQWG3_25020, partial [Salmonella enterica subsp. enterica serovar Infantis]
YSYIKTLKNAIKEFHKKHNKTRKHPNINDKKIAYHQTQSTKIYKKKQNNGKYPKLYIINHQVKI